MRAHLIGRAPAYASCAPLLAPVSSAVAGGLFFATRRRLCSAQAQQSFLEGRSRSSACLRAARTSHPSWRQFLVLFFWEEPVTLRLATCEHHEPPAPVSAPKVPTSGPLQKIFSLYSRSGGARGSRTIFSRALSSTLAVHNNGRELASPVAPRPLRRYRKTHWSRKSDAGGALRAQGHSVHHDRQYGAQSGPAAQRSGHDGKPETGLLTILVPPSSRCTSGTPCITS